MKIASKGYTLVELLISMAIFSIIMVGIVSIMRTASVSFNNESVEVNLQEESQILLSQVEELLVDCHKCTSVTGGYKIQLSESNTDNIWLRFHDNSVYYSENSTGTGEELIASDVKVFQINGLDTTNGDNVCIVKVELSKNAGDRAITYDSSKNIVFRNNVEGNLDRDDSNSSHFINNASSNGGGGGANERTLYVGRYQVVDLQQLYGITSVTSYDDDDTEAYVFINPSSVDSTTGGIGSAPDYSYTTQTEKSIYFTTSDNTNSSLDDEFSAEIIGSTGSQTLTIHLKTKPCKFQKGTGIVEFPNKSVNPGTDGGFLSYVTFEGFCFGDYLKYNSSESISGGISFPANSEAKTGTIISARYDNDYGQFDYQYHIGLSYDPYENDKLVVRFVNGHTDSSANNLASGNKKIKLSVTLPGSTDPYEETFYAVSSGSNLTNVN